MQYYIHHNNEQIGPFTEAEVKAKLASGEVLASDHVWWQGQQGWVPLSQTALGGGTGAPVVPGTTAAAAYPAGGAVMPTSKLAIWALVCGCLSLLCGIFASIPAIILGHMGLKETKLNPAIQGRGMALAGMILGYVFTALIVAYLIFVFVIFASLSKNVKTTFDTINAQLQAAQAAEATNNATSPASSSDQTTNTPASSAPDQSTNAPASTNNQDMSTNSAPSTNAPDSSTNAAPVSQ